MNILGGLGNEWNYDAWMTVVTLVLALGWLLVVNVGVRVYKLPSTLSRKIIHTGTGPLFVLCWPFFSEAVYARYLAAIVPLGLTLVFFLVGMGWLDNPDLVRSSTRNGDRTELLKGPLYYGIAFILCTILFWRTSPVGILALMMLCGGDGLADIVGRRWGKRKLPFSPDKSWVGSLAMFFGSFGFGLGYLLLFNQWGYFQPELAVGHMVVVVGAIAFIATLVESLPVKDIDNIALTIVVIGLGYWWL
ncbi:MAG: phosphatidate cytidylyltransferase [Cyanobacteria bacterium P01_F01_bin.150]